MLGDIYSEFVDSFDSSSKINRTWVKGGMVNEDPKISTSKKSSSKLYKPTSMLAAKKPAVAIPDVFVTRSRPAPVKKPNYCSNNKIQDKKMSNLEMFKEELRKMQESRTERKNIKSTMTGYSNPQDSASTTTSTTASNSSHRIQPYTSALSSQLSLAHDDAKNFSYDNESMSTNLYLGNISPDCTEDQLCKLFGSYGALASVKIMWPRSDESRSRNRNSGFVAFMSRRDAERCINNLQGQMIQNHEMKLGWGKVVPLPHRPVYIPPQLLVCNAAPPCSGMPFNAQHRRAKRLRDVEHLPDKKRDKLLMKCVVQVTIPQERSILILIHRIIEFVIREGPMFEAIIMNRSMNNSSFKFLFDNKSQEHIYYRWKLYSILQGDSVKKWRTRRFQMFTNGSWWQPPKMLDYTQGMSEGMYLRGAPGIKPVASKSDKFTKEKLSRKPCIKLMSKIRHLTTCKNTIGETMSWCISHSSHAFNIVEIICMSFDNPTTIPIKKIARLYLVSDLLHNSSAKVPHASFYRKFFETKLPNLFYNMHICYNCIPARLKAEQFKQKVMTCFNAWDDWAIYPNDLLIKLQNIFLGLAKPGKDGKVEMLNSISSSSMTVLGSLQSALPASDEDEDDADGLDGRAMSDCDDIDGIEMDEQDDDDLDGVPMDEELPLSKDEEHKVATASKSSTGGFMSCKWQSVDESKLVDQAMTTSKWDELETPATSNSDLQRILDLEENIDGCPMIESLQASPLRNKSPDDSSKSNISEEKRQKLREIEVKVMKYQDDIESGRRSRKDGMSLIEQCKIYRKKLIDRDEKEERENKTISLVSYLPDSPSSTDSREIKKSSRRRSRSPKTRHHRSRSNSRERTRRRRSRSPRSRRSRSRSPRRKHKKTRR